MQSETETRQATGSVAPIPEIRWADIDPRCGILYYKGFVGNWGLFRIRPMFGDTLNFYVSTLLPGMKGVTTSAGTLKEAQYIATRMLEHWLDMLHRDGASCLTAPAVTTRLSEIDVSNVVRLARGPHTTIQR